MNDPRFKNQIFETSSPSQYLISYSRELGRALGQVDSRQLDAAYEIIKDALKRGARIYVAGNGGSSAIADHLCCDWMKGTAVPNAPSLKVHSLTSNSALFTALANDFSYEESLSRQIDMLCEPGDIVVLISSSGNSPNIVKALEAARTKRVKTIGLSGFNGGKLAAAADISLHVPVDNYGLAEDAHQAVMHVLAQFLAKERDSR